MAGFMITEGCGTRCPSLGFVITHQPHQPHQPSNSTRPSNPTWPEPHQPKGEESGGGLVMVGG